MRSLGWALIQCDQCPSERRNADRLAHRERPYEREGGLRAKERSLEQTPPFAVSEGTSLAPTLTSDFLPPDRETTNLGS